MWNIYPTTKLNGTRCQHAFQIQGKVWCQQGTAAPSKTKTTKQTKSPTDLTSEQMHFAQSDAGGASWQQESIHPICTSAACCSRHAKLWLLVLQLLASG